jgi:16S rRNA (guanine527-N7)-methyltransferase
MIDVTNLESISYEIRSRLASAGLASLDSAQLGKFGAYLGLILRWNARTNLTSIRDADGIVERHFVECIACAQALPRGVATLLDFGSGAGFPGIPIAVCRPEISVTLAESQNKKAAFLLEVVRTLGLTVRVHSGRAEDLRTSFDCVTMRAVDRMEAAVAAASELVGTDGWLAPLTTDGKLATVKAVGEGFHWDEPRLLSGSEGRVLALGRKRVS